VPLVCRCEKLCAAGGQTKGANFGTKDHTQLKTAIEHERKRKPQERGGFQKSILLVDIKETQI
jgi:hypothetical protein